MSDSDKGQIIVPTGGGKTMCMIEDVKRQFKSPVSKTIVVVAPRILLANHLTKNVTIIHTNFERCKRMFWCSCKEVTT